MTRHVFRKTHVGLIQDDRDNGQDFVGNESKSNLLTTRPYSRYLALKALAVSSEQLMPRTFMLKCPPAGRSTSDFLTKPGDPVLSLARNEGDLIESEAGSEAVEDFSTLMGTFVLTTETSCVETPDS